MLIAHLISFVKQRQFGILIGLILAVALFLRVWQFGSLPASLYFEEPALGYDAYSIFKTGRDMHGNSFPIVAFPSFGDYKPSGYFYLVAPFVGIWGMSDSSVRLPSLLLGMITIVMVIMISQGIFNNRTIALFSGLTIAVMPTAVHLSRAAFEVNAAVGLLSIALACFLWIKKYPRLLCVSIIFLAASMYTYHSLRLVAPLIFLLTLFVFGNPLHLLRQKVVWANGGLFILLIMPIMLAIRSPEVVHRYQEVAFFPHYSQAVAITNELRAMHGNTLGSRIVYHRYWIQAYEFAQNILKHFWPDFLLVHGDGNLRHQDTSQGILLWWMFVFIIISPLFALKRKKVEWNYLFYFGLGLIICATPASLSVPVPHTLRNHASVLLWSLIVGWAAAKIFLHVRKRKLLLIALGLIICAETTYFWGNYYAHYNQKSFADWGYGYKQVAQFIETETSDDQSIYITRDYGRPITYMLFYLSMDPRSVQASDGSAPKDQQERLTFANIDFVDNRKDYDWRIESQPFSRAGYALQDVIEDPSQNPIFYLYKKQ